MKNILKIVLLFSLIPLSSCDEELDINTDPNYPPQINSGLALASAEASLVTVVGGDLTNLGGFYAQYHTQAPGASQYLSIDQYNINVGYANRLWTELYAGCLNDLQYVLNESNRTGDTGTALIATVLKSYTFQVLVDLFDAVPYEEAFQGLENITPAPTPGNVIYPDLIAKIDQALAAYNANRVASGVGSQDMIYQANMQDWIRFANTLKLKLYMRMSYTELANPAAVNALIAQNNFITQDARFTNFGTSTNQRNPFYEVQLAESGLNDVNNIASNSLHEFYNENNDPRLQAAYRPNGATNPVYVSLPQGAGPGLSSVATNYSRPRVFPTTPVYLMTVAESNFLQAEGLIRYAGGAGAQQKYNQGIIASFVTYQNDFKFVTSTGQEITTPAIELAQPFITAGGRYEYQSGASVEETVRQVIVQKWASLAYVNNIEAYFETVRTKYPEIVPEVNADYARGNRIPSRVSVLQGLNVPTILFYPENEVNRNPNIRQRASLTERVWWDRKQL
ncbi:MAG TPA: SusD/RagB family nutrient-binding outer membrane lipoprotein [Flavobacterium sp.]|jgi:hypothetical protein